MQKIRQLASRLRGRMVYSAIAVAMGVSTLVAGLERTSFLGSATGQRSESVGTSLVPDVHIDQLAQYVAAGVTTPTAQVATTLDSGVDHPRIDRWVQRLTTSLKGDFKQ